MWRSSLIKKSQRRQGKSQKSLSSNQRQCQKYQPSLKAHKFKKNSLSKHKKKKKKNLSHNHRWFRQPNKPSRMTTISEISKRQQPQNPKNPKHPNRNKCHLSPNRTTKST